jgi:hypothetical protein
MSAFTMVGWFTYTIPVSISRATRLPRSVSLVKTDPPRPKGESLATAIASASSRTRMTIETGPKNSS